MQRNRTTTIRVSLGAALFCLLLASTQARGQTVAGYSEYILPGDELNMYYIFNNLDANAGSTVMHSVISVTAWSPNTTVYYDHWENGYNFDPNNPGATADEAFTLSAAGQVLAFESANVPSGGPPPNPRSAAATTCAGQLDPLGNANGNRCYDGGDRIYVAGGAVTVTRATWIDAVGAGNQADAWEIYPVKPQLTTYVVGFGEDLYATSATYFTGFQRVYALIQSTADNTTVTVDLNHDGVPDVLNQNRGATWNTAGPGTVTATNGSTAVVGAGGTAFLTSVYPNQPIIIAGVEYVVASVTDNTHLTLTASYAGTTGAGLTYTAGEGSTIYLNKGQTFLLDRISACPSHVTCTTAPGTLNTGAVITGNQTLQVKYVTGRPTTTYTARGISAFPRGFWSNQYYAPFGQGASGNGDTDYYLFNPNSAALTVNWQGTTTSGSFSIPANSTESFNRAIGAIPSVPVGSGLYFSASSPFWGVGFGDSTAGAYEWAYSLLPTEFLFREHYFGWSPGSYPLLSAPTNGDSAFLTVAQDNTKVFVDYNDDGVADQTYTLNRLQSQFVPPNPTTGALTGARFWATGLFTMSYGENPDTANTSNPSLDLGYVALPATDFVSLVLTVAKSANPEVVSTASGSYTDFTINVDSQAYSVDGVYVVDTLPPNWQYTSGHTTITRPDLTQSNADPTITGAGTAANPYVLTWSAAQTEGNMAPNQEITITFRAQTTAVLATGTLSQNNVAATGTRTVGSGPAVTQTFTATDFAFVTSGNIGITKTSNAGTPAYPGDTFTYTTTVTNPALAGTNVLTGVSLYDAVPTGLTNVAGTTTLSSSTVADRFNTAAYSNNDGTRSWAGDWTETDAYGTGPGGAGAGAAGGFAWVTGGQLQFRYLLSTVADNFDTNGSYSGNNGSSNWNADWTETNDDGAAATGFIQVIGNHARFRGGGAAQANRSISRTATVTGATSATINFALTDNGIDGGETMVAEYSVDGGAYVTIGTLDGSAGWTWGVGGAVPLTISLTGSNNTLTIRFRAPQVWSSTSNDEARVDNVSISYNSPASASGTLVKRTVSLTGATTAWLNFSYASANLAAGDTVVIEASSAAAGPFTTLATFTAGTPNVAPSYDVSSYISANTTIQFRVTGGINATNKSFSVDDLSITYNVSVTGPNPPELIPASYLYTLVGGQSLTTTFNVTVNNPFPPGQTLVTNTASVTSVQLPIPLPASKTDVVANPIALSATVAGRIWLDGNANGLDDIGEPGIANVQVTLRDQYGAPVVTTLTDTNGRFLFTGVNPGTGYYVQATAPPDPAGMPLANLTQSAPSGHTDYRTTAFTLSAGQNYTGADEGYKPATGTVSFGDLVWIDPNADGVRENGEVGLGGVTLRLYKDTGDNVLNTLVDTFVAVPTIGAGTIAVTNASTTVTGTNTKFTSLGVGDPIVIGGVSYPIATITSDTSLTLTANYGGTTASGLTYTVVSTKGAGTVAATNGSPSVVGTGTSFMSLLPGDPIEINGVKYKVNSLTDATHLTLTANYAGATASGLTYGLATPTISGADGSYLFAGVTPPSGTYFVSARIPAGYTSTTGIIYKFTNVTSGFAYLTADFGFNLGTTYSITDRVWWDTNGNGVYDDGATGIAGVTVALLDASLNVIGTTTTDSNGVFSFSGLRGGGADYTTRITDTGAVLVNFYGTTSYAIAGQRLEPNLTASIDRSAAPSYGYNVIRAIGDTVYNDLNGNGSQDSGEPGIGGVVVSLYRDVNADGLIDLTTITGPGTVSVTNGSAAVTGTGTTFTNLHAGETITINNGASNVAYTILSITDATHITLTTTYAGTTNAARAYYAAPMGPGTVAATNGSATVTGTGTSFFNYHVGEPIVISGVEYIVQSVASNTSLTLTTNYTGGTASGLWYVGPAASAGTVATTSGSAAVTGTGTTFTNYVAGQPITINNVPYTILSITDATHLTLTTAAGATASGLTYYGPGGPLETVLTDANGRYLFPGLANGSYIVSVPPRTGYTYISGGRTDTDATFPGIQLAATISGTADILNRDFGFQATTSLTLGGTVWNDLDADGAIDNGEPRLAGVTLNVLSGSTVIAIVTTDGNGNYSLPGLAPGMYTVRVTDTSGVLTGYNATYEYDVHTAGPFDGQTSVTLTTSNITNVNFGFKQPGPTYASLDSFTAFVSNRTVTVQWRTSSELGTIGFNLLRYDPATASFRQLNDALLPGLIVHPEGGVYRYRDDDAPLQGSLTYKLIEVDIQDRQREHGPFTIALSSQPAPETESEEVEESRWSDDVLFQNRPNELAKEQQERMLTVSAKQLAAAEAAPHASLGTVKITTDGDGLYYVSASQIGTALGTSSSSAAALIARGQVDITSLGTDVRYLPASDGSGLYFYADQPQTIYSAESAYLLTATHGATMGGAPKGTRGPTATSFAATLHREENHYPLPILFTDPDGDFWCWDYVIAGYPGSDSKSFAIHVPGVAGNGKANLNVLLHGGSDTLAPLDHHAVIFWNGTQVGEARWDGTTEYELTIPLSAAAVQEGDNTLELLGVLNPGVDYSIIYLDYFELTYQRLFRAEDDELTFTAPNASTITVGGFSSPDILVLDLGSSKEQPSVVTFGIDAAQDGTYQAHFLTPSGRTPRSYLALVKQQAREPLRLTSMQLAGLKNQSNRADYVLIAPDSLLTATKSLAAYRSAQGLETMVVALNDIYNEFNDGNASPYAIQEFLSYAVSRWQKPPHYATLVGRGTYDYKDYMGVGDCLVPPLMTATPSGPFVSDARLADLTGNDGVPEIAVGRLPVLTSQDVTNYLTKIQAREQASNPRQVLMAADNPDVAGSFNAESDAVAAIVPSGYTVLKVYLPAYSAAAGEQAIINAINSGAIVFNYIGHGGPGQLADEKLFQTSDVSALTNATTMPIFLGMTCAAGNFGFPGFPSLAEKMLLKQGGGVYASWTSSGLSVDNESVLLDKAFFTAAFVNRTKVLGDIIVSLLRSRSVAAVPPSTKNMYNLLGEPVSRLP